MPDAPIERTDTEDQFLIDLVFKPLDPDLKLRPEEIQLILSCIGEILRELEKEERSNTQRQDTLMKREDLACT